MSKHHKSFARENRDTFMRENLSGKKKNPNGSLILDKQQWVRRGEGMGGGGLGFWNDITWENVWKLRFNKLLEFDHWTKFCLF